MVVYTLVLPTARVTNAEAAVRMQKARDSPQSHVCVVPHVDCFEPFTGTAAVCVSVAHSDDSSYTNHSITQNSPEILNSEHFYILSTFLCRKKRKVYAVRRHSGSLCAQRQPGI